MSDRTKLILVYVVQIVFACALMLHWFIWAPGGAAGKDQFAPWPLFQKGGLRENLGHIALQAGLILACFGTERSKRRITKRMKK